MARFSNEDLRSRLHDYVNLMVNAGSQAGLSEDQILDSIGRGARANVLREIARVFPQWHNFDR